MHKQTIRRLNQLNQNFYYLTAKYFNKTRMFSWNGWYSALDNLPKFNHKINILDVGCGNARFANFCLQQLKDEFFYHGIDNNEKLLKIAKARTKALNMDGFFERSDIITNLLDEKPIAKITKQYHLISLLGLMHHIPGYNTRKQLIKNLVEYLQPNGYFLITFWQFANADRFENRKVNPKIVDIDPEDLDENDYILDWRKGELAYRYCHFTDDVEAEKMFDELNLKIVDSYYDDGRSRNLNLYYVLTQ